MTSLTCQTPALSAAGLATLRLTVKGIPSSRLGKELDLAEDHNVNALGRKCLNLQQRLKHIQPAQKGNEEKTTPLRKPHAPLQSSFSNHAPRVGATDTGGKFHHDKRRLSTRRRSRRRLLTELRALKVTAQKQHQRNNGGRNLGKQRQHPSRQDLEPHYRRHFQHVERAQLSILRKEEGSYRSATHQDGTCIGVPAEQHTEGSCRRAKHSHLTCPSSAQKQGHPKTAKCMTGKGTGNRCGQQAQTCHRRRPKRRAC